MSDWLANRYVKGFQGDLTGEVEFRRTSAGEDGWEWMVWRDNPDEPLASGRKSTDYLAKVAAAAAARRLLKEGK